jgi:hypothetical protein
MKYCDDRPLEIVVRREELGLNKAKLRLELKGFDIYDSGFELINGGANCSICFFGADCDVTEAEGRYCISIRKPDSMLPHLISRRKAAI